jgi:hypothetical protein
MEIRVPARRIRETLGIGAEPALAAFEQQHTHPAVGELESGHDAGGAGAHHYDLI